MKNKNRIYRAAALLLVLCFISTVMISGTFAKYTSEYSGSDTALVARWSFKALGQDPETSSTELDLFQHEFDKHINQRNGEKGDYIIAPGVEGKFVVAMDYLADVDAKVTVDFTRGGTAGKGFPIEYSVKEGYWVKLTDLPAAFVEAVTNNNDVTDAADNTFTFSKSSIDPDVAATEISQVVKWRWAFDKDEQGDDDSTGFESDNATDTAFGNASAGDDGRLSYILNVSVTAEQLKPTTEGTEG